MPSNEPPATSTWPFATTLAGKSVAEWAWRGDVRVPAGDQVPEPEAALKCSVVPSVVEPLLPPTMSTLPFAKAVAVCPSRVLDSAVIVVHDDVPSKRCTVATLVVPPEFPPTTKTLLFSVALPGTTSRVAVCALRGDDMLPTAVQLPEPEPGLYLAAVFKTVEPFIPPATSTWPLASNVAVCSCRAALRFAAATHVPAVGE